MSLPASRPIRVVVVDDSAVVRRLVSDTLNAETDIEVVGTANDPFMARDRIKELKPDVITLDIEMPRMDGITFLRILMREHPMPVIVMSSISQAGSEVAMEALRLGAIDVLAKPNGSYSFGDLGPQLLRGIRAARLARLRPSLSPATSPVPPATTPAAVAPASRRPARAPAPAVLPLAHSVSDPRRLIVLGASTGGTEALREVLTRLPDGLPPIAIVQHIPAVFSKAFAERLDSLCAFRVREAGDNEPLLPGEAVVAPGNFHLLLRWSGQGYRTGLSTGPQVWHQRPAVDVLFKSIPPTLARCTLAGVLTGMGKDGAEGLRRLRDNGAQTFAQDEASSVVYGMPREAWEQGGAECQLSIDDIAAHIVQLCEKRVWTPSHAHA